MTIESLHEKYFGLFGELFFNRALLTEKQYDVMAKVLHKQYLDELNITLTEKLLEVGTNNFELKFRSRVYVPLRGLFGYNKIARRLLKQYKAEFITELKRLKLDVRAEKELHREIDEKIEKTSETETTALIATNSTIDD